MVGSPAVRTSQLTKRFGKRTALDAVDLEVAPGSIFGYLGPNGAGKTTTIKLLAGLFRPSAGRASVLGLDTVRDRDRIQATLGYLPGDFTGYADHTGTRFLEFLGALRGGVDWTYVERLAERFDIDLSRRLGQLSHGNRQKIGIIQAFMHRPQLLLLDEPTNGLDPLMQREFLALLRETRAAGDTVLLSSHVLSEVSEVADTVGILNEGKLLATRSMQRMRDDAVRRVDLTFDDQVPAAPIRRAAGVRDVRIDGLTAHVGVCGSMAELFSAVAPYGVVDVQTHETDLSDFFLSYYGRDRRDDDDLGLRESTVGPAQGAARVG